MCGLLAFPPSMSIPILEQGCLSRIPLEEGVLRYAVGMRHSDYWDALEQLVPDVKVSAETVSTSSRTPFDRWLPNEPVFSVVSGHAGSVLAIIVGDTFGGPGFRGAEKAESRG